MTQNVDSSGSESNVREWFAKKLVVTGGVVFFWGTIWAFAPVLPQYRPEGYAKALVLWVLAMVLVGLGFRLGGVPEGGDA